ncbi:MAG: TRAP transporter fused permease subunit, partial [Pseudomonadota bacterium]
MSDKTVDIQIAEEDLATFRKLDGWLNFSVKWTLVAIPLVACFFIMDIPFYLKWSIMMEQYYGLILAMVFPCVFILVPMTKKAPMDRVPWYDFILAILGIVVGLYVTLFYRQISIELGNVNISPDRVVVGTLAFGLILEGCRRATNWILSVFALLFILLPHFTGLLPDIFSRSRLPFDQQVNYLFLDTNGVFSSILGVAAVVLPPFILFGSLFSRTGGGAFITDVAMATLGKTRGGPAKMAVVASGLFGTISGLAVANVITTGCVTIPLMKKTGYKPHMAGAIEAVASSGGQIMPPVMAAVAFIMAEYIGVPYRDVCIAAALPAVLYYAALFFQVDMEAGKTGLKGLPPEQLPELSGVISKSYLFIVPFGILMLGLFVLCYTPERSALVASISLLVLGFFLHKETRFSFRWFLEALQQTGRSCLPLFIICSLAGIIVGTVSYTGLGFLIPLYLDQIAGGSLIVLLLFAAVVALILGMGMPPVSVYVVLATLIAPGMVNLGIDKMAAHMFLFYYACIGMITPPVALAAYAGAALAGANFWRTGYSATRLGIVAYVVPFLFVFTPGLLLKGSLVWIVAAVVPAVFGIFVLCIALAGYFINKIGFMARALFGLSGMALLFPIRNPLNMLDLFINIGGGGLALLLLIWEWKRTGVEEVLP